MSESTEATTIEGWADVDALESFEPEGPADAAVEADAPHDADDLPPSAEADAEAPHDVEDADALADDGEPDAPDSDPPTSDESQPAAEPFRFKVDGQEFDVPGAEVTPEGEIRGITLDVWQTHIRPRLADRGAWQRKEQGYRQQIAELEQRANPDTNPDVVRSRELGKAFDALMELPPDQLYQRMIELQQQWPLLRERAEKLALQRQLETRDTQAHSVETERLVQEWTPKLQGGLQTGVEQVLASDDYKELGLDAAEIANQLWEDPALRRAAIRVAQEGDETGLPAGTPYVALDWIDRYLRPTAKAALKRIEDARKAAEARKRNAARLGEGKRAAGVGVQGAPPPGGRAEKDPESYDDWLASLRSI